jgi:hypothetical protein
MIMIMMRMGELMVSWILAEVEVEVQRISLEKEELLDFLIAVFEMPIISVTLLHLLRLLLLLPQ